VQLLQLNGDLLIQDIQKKQLIFPLVGVRGPVAVRRGGCEYGAWGDMEYLASLQVMQ